MNYPYDRLQISGVESRLRELGRKLNIDRIHPHKFRRTMATRAIDKGMPIEQVQKLLGHTEEILVEYSDSMTDPWYDIDVADGVLKIEKNKGTVGVEENSVVITLPRKEYKNISIDTSNGDIVFENVLSEKYKCFVENGDITGTLNGNEKDYLIVVKAKNGDSNITDNVIESSKSIEFNVENGNVNIDFSE